MIETIPSLAQIRRKSMELHFPYEEALSVFILQQTVSVISNLEGAECFWLKNDFVLNIETFRKRSPLSLKYAVQTEDELTKEKIDDFLQGESWIKYQSEKREDKIYVFFTAVIEELQIPVELVFEKILDDTLRPKEEEFELLFQENQRVKYRHYPIEGLLAEHFICILKNLELLNDLSSYDILYDLLKHEMGSTRKVTEQIELLVKEFHIPIEEERFEMICDYRESSYMKKRWKAYLRKEKRKNPSFEKVMEIIITYFRPIWEALEKGTYYLGDWMPELERYLD